jgi:hypothetical protein
MSRPATKRASSPTPKRTSGSPKAETGVRVRIADGASLLHEGATYYAGHELVVPQKDATALVKAGTARIADTIADEPARAKASRSSGSRSSK